MQATEDGKLGHKGVFKTVYPGELEAATREGWRLVQVLQCDVLARTEQDMFITPDPNAWGQHANPPSYKVQSRDVYRQDLKFLLMLDEASALATMSACLSEARTEREAAIADRTEAEKATALAEKAKAEALALARNCNEMSASNSERMRATHELNKKLEADIGTIRKAIGEREMNAILTPVTST